VRVWVILFDAVVPKRYYSQPVVQVLWVVLTAVVSGMLDV